MTYPQCELTKEQIKDALVDHKVQEYVIANEKHQDGNLHAHVFLKYKDRQTWSETKWDIGTFHGNYQVAKSWKAVIDYVKKDGDYIANIDLKAAMGHKAKN